MLENAINCKSWFQVQEIDKKSSKTGDFVSLKRSQRFTRLLAKHTILEITESKSAIENEMIQSNCNRGPLSRIIINFNMISQKGPFITIAL